MGGTVKNEKVAGTHGNYQFFSACSRMKDETNYVDVYSGYY